MKGRVMEKKVTLGEVDMNHILEAIRLKLIHLGREGVFWDDQSALNSTVKQYHQLEETILKNLNSDDV